MMAEMSKEEVLQLIRRIDQLESNLARAISRSGGMGGVGRGRGSRDLGEPPKIGEIKKIDGAPIMQEDRPLLEDVLDTVIVSVDEEEEG